MLIQRDQMIKATNIKDQKLSWNLFKQDYETKLKTHIKNKRIGESLNCKRCDKIVDKTTYVAHNLKNCVKIHPHMKWMNFRKQFQ